MAVIEHLTITDPDSNGDGLVLINDTFTVRDCVVDFSAQPLAGLDECISTVNHAEAEIEGCTFRGSSKGALFGNGDYPDTDPGAQVYMHNCVMENCGRRFPEAQDGVKVILERCTIRNWGIKDRFDVRAFGAWAHHGATIICIDCTFEQTAFFQTGILNFFIDLANHIGQAVNDRGLFGLTWRDFIPGVCRGLIATDGGKVGHTGSKKNKWWIFLDKTE